jgi:hypothetical protein
MQLTTWLLLGAAVATPGLLACSGSNCGPSTCTGCCDSSGRCQSATAAQCGMNGAACIACLAGAQCVQGACQACAPSCGGRQCGSDGCGGSCGSCGGGLTCSDAGTCAGANDPCNGVPTTGICASSTTIALCSVPTGSVAPSVTTYACAGGESCQMQSGRAACVLTGACREGSTQCASQSQIQTCTNGAWVSSNCAGPCTTTALGALCGANVATTPVTAILAYQLRGPNASPPTDWGPLTTSPAQHVLLLSCVGGSCATGNLIDAQYTALNTGSFTIKVPSTPGASDFVAVLLAADDGQGGLAYVVADPGFAAPGTQSVGAVGPNPRLWSWTIATTLLTPGSTFTVTEAQGSGAARVFDVLRFVDTFARGKYGNKLGLSLVAWLGIGTGWSCGKCFAPVPTTFSSIPFQSQVWFNGDSNESYWADPVTAHELGHRVMASYGTLPGEGGTHCLGVPEFPGLAWSEGWATWFSSDVRQSSIYYDKQSGSMFWLDIGARAYSGALWNRPTASAGLQQLIDENEVSAMNWGLAAGAGSDAALFAAIATPRMNTPPYHRGYNRHASSGVDSSCHPINPVDTGISAPFYADFLDALDCGGFPAASIDAQTVPATDYPYPSATPICQ